MFLSGIQEVATLDILDSGDSRFTSLTKAIDVLREISQKFLAAFKCLQEPVREGRCVVAGIKRLLDTSHCDGITHINSGKTGTDRGQETDEITNGIPTSIVTTTTQEESK